MDGYTELAEPQDIVSGSPTPEEVERSLGKAISTMLTEFELSHPLTDPVWESGLQDIKAHQELDSLVGSGIEDHGQSDLDWSLIQPLFTEPVQGLRDEVWLQGIDRVRLQADNKKVLADNELEWDLLFNRYSRLVWSVVNRLTDDDHIRSTASQRTWERLASNLEIIHLPSLAAWLTITARREVYSLLRKEDLADTIAHTLENLGKNVPSDQLDQNLLTEISTLSTEVRSAISKLLSDREILMLELMLAGQLSYSEIGAVVGLPHGAVGPTRTRIFKKLTSDPTFRQLLADSFDQRTISQRIGLSQ